LTLDTIVVPVKVGKTNVSVRVIQDTSDKAASKEQRVSGHVLNFEDVTVGIEALCHSLGGMLSRVAPTKASVEFNVGVTLKTGKLTALFLEGQTEGSIKIALEWSSDKQNQAPEQE
jgi:hypothetical protein